MSETKRAKEAERALDDAEHAAAQEAHDAVEAPGGAAPVAVMVEGGEGAATTKGTSSRRGRSARKEDVATAVGAAAPEIALDQASAGTVTGERVTITQGGAAIIRGERVTVDQGGALVIVGRRVEVNEGGALIIVARKVTGDARALLDARGALVLLAGWAVLKLLFRGRR